MLSIGNVKRTSEDRQPVAVPECAGQEVIERIKRCGAITFADFMEIALYADSVGYYTSELGRWGESADYVTSIDISPAFARSIARQVLEMWTLSGKPDSLSLIEAGAGRGWLGTGILDTIKSLSTECFNAVTLTLVDKGITGAHSIIDERGLEGKILRLPELPASSPVPFGIVISNELIDSLPVHRLTIKEGVLKEIFVDYKENAFIEVLKEPSSVKFIEYLAGFELLEGQKVEVNINAAKWIASAASCFDRGFVITVDYGLPAAELYAPGRPSTLICHLRHKLNDKLYDNIGRQDITAHIDFTNMVNAGTECGLERTGFTTQKHFLLGAGVLEDLREVTEEKGLEMVEIVRHNRSVHKLIAEGGMGDIFKVLIQHKGFDTAPALRGFDFKDMSRYL